jgi:hypothetical protein
MCLTGLIVGTLVVIHGNVLHKSEANRSLKSRYIYTFHVIEGDAEYDEKNWYLPSPNVLIPGYNQQRKGSLESINHRIPNPIQSLIVW